MKPLVAIYIIRVGLGAISGIISAFVASVSSPTELTTFLNSLTIALAVYLLSYYAIKTKFYNKVEKQSKIMTMGIGIFFISWIVFLVLIYTILIGPVAVV
ncbi:hypothetical protein MUO66_09180 [Candidatus Bathyarchaeota archaeon]|nr:hypothetical protein [Candidatus Bathyarchaeota archaeon]